MVDVLQLAFRVLHIIAGVMWVGGLFLWGMVIAPTLTKRVAPQVRGPFMGAVLPRLSRYLGIAGVTTVITGLITMGLIYEFENMVPVFQNEEAGVALGVALVLSIAMLVIAYGIVIPSGQKMLAMMPKGDPSGTPPAAPPPEMVALAKRLGMFAMVNLGLGTLALVTMAWAVSARSGL